MLQRYTMKRTQRSSQPEDRWQNIRWPRSRWIEVSCMVFLLTGCAVGQYRMPFEDGTIVVVNRDHVNHDDPPAYSYDIEALNPVPGSIVAAAPGIVRFVVEGNAEPTNDNNYVWIEHPQYNYECGGEFCTEWTIYAHFEQNSVAVERGDIVLAGSFLGIESDVGDAQGRHLHWHVAILPPYIEPTFNGYYRDYWIALGEGPELIPIVCHQGGESVLWRNSTYTAAGCPASGAPLPAAAPPIAALTPHKRSEDGFDHVRRALPAGSPIRNTIERIARVSDEAVDIALADPPLAARTVSALMTLKPAFEELRSLGRARISTTELEMVRDLLAEYDVHGSERMHAALAPLRRMLAQPAGAQGLGLILQNPSNGLHQAVPRKPKLDE